MWRRKRKRKGKEKEKKETEGKLKAVQKKRPAIDLRNESHQAKSRFSDSEMEEIVRDNYKVQAERKEKTFSDHKENFAKLYKTMKVLNKITKLNSNFEKIYHLLETHFAPRPMEVIVPDPGPAVDKGTTGNHQLDESHFISVIYFITLEYALALLDALFTKDEQATSCFKESTRPSSCSQSQKPPLSPIRVKLIEECIDKKFGQGTAAANDPKITESLNQKCRDRLKK
eukprot:Em0128g6a